MFPKRPKRQANTAGQAHSGPEPNDVNWNIAELENKLSYEVIEASKPLPELPEECRTVQEMPSHYIGTEMRDTSRRAWLRFASPLQPVEVPLASALDDTNLKQ